MMRPGMGMGMGMGMGPGGPMGGPMGPGERDSNAMPWTAPPPRVPAVLGTA